MPRRICKKTILKFSAKFQIIKLNITNNKIFRNRRNFQMRNKTLRNLYQNNQKIPGLHIRKILISVYKNIHPPRTLTNFYLYILHYLRKLVRSQHNLNFFLFSFLDNHLMRTANFYVYPLFLVQIVFCFTFV